MKAQAGVAAGILIAVVLAVGILIFAGESPSRKKKKKDTSAISGFLEAGKCVFPETAEGKCAGSAPRDHPKVKCGAKCIKTEAGLKAALAKDKGQKVDPVLCPELCVRQICEGTHYNLEEVAECQNYYGVDKKQHPISENGYSCKEFQAGPEEDKTTCFQRVQRCPPDFIEDGRDEYYTKTGYKTCEERAKVNGKCEKIGAWGVPCWKYNPPEGCDALTNKREKIIAYGDEDTCKKSCKKEITDATGSSYTSSFCDQGQGRIDTRDSSGVIIKSEIISCFICNGRKI